MTTDYKVIIRNKSGAKVAEITDHLALAYRKRLMDVGKAGIQLPGQHDAIALTADKYQVEIQRQNLARGLLWYPDFYGFVRGEESGWDDAYTYHLMVDEEKVLLRWRIIAYRANVSGRSKFAAGKGETIAKEMVKYNATSSGTTGDGRMVDATSGGAVNGYTVTIQTDGLAGNTVDWYCAWDNLLASLQKLARISGGDFDLIKTAASTYQFRWYATRRGTDLTATVKFGVDRGNMRQPKLVYDRTDEKTVAIVGGGGKDSNRAVYSRTGDNYSAADNNIEMFVDGRDLGTDQASLEDRGDQKLDAAQARKHFEWEVVQTDTDAYGLNYCIAGQMGDLVRASFAGYQVDQKVVAVEVEQKKGENEKIKIEVADA